MRRKDLPVVAIVVPCYNEEEVLPETVQRLTELVEGFVEEKLIHKKSCILFIDDGSSDRTWSLIAMESVKNPYVTGIKLARNVGHQKALLAGLETTMECDCVISIDADLQDDISVIRKFIEKYQEGFDIVYGVRKERAVDTKFKRATALAFYKLMKKLHIPLIYNHADFRLMSKRALSELFRYRETNVFLRGIIPLIGLPSTFVFYDRKARLAGKTKYPLKKMIAFALDGLTSFSVAPIRLITFSGFVIFLLSIINGIYALFQKLVGKTDVGWTSLIISIWLIGGLQLVAVGVIGEYIGKIFTEVKARPKYTIEIDLFHQPMLPKRSEELQRSEKLHGDEQFIRKN